MLRPGFWPQSSGDHVADPRGTNVGLWGWERSIVNFYKG